MASSINASTSGAGGVITTADNTGILNLQTASTNAVTIDASQNVTIAGNTYLASTSGNVGIGTTNPSYKLQVSNTNGDTQVGVYDLSSSSSAARLDIRTSGTGASQWFIQTGNTASGLNGALRFYDQSVTTERMRITSAGALCLGGTSTITGYVFTMYHTDTSGMAYKYNGTSEQNSCSFQNGNGQVGRIYTSGTSTTYSTSSDYRLKENVVPMTGALDKVAQLNPVTFTWKTDGTDGQGFIAHELQAVVPDCVGGTKDAVDAEGNPVYQDIDTSFLVATLTAAIKEQQTIINDLKARVTALEAK